KIAKEVTKNKPIIVLKAGRSKRGAMAAASHTGSLAGSDTIYSAAFKQTGILRAMNVAEAFDWARAIAELPPPEGEDTIIITNGGGVGVMATDACEDYNVKLMNLPEDLAQEFRKYMPPFGSVKNPIDLTGQASEKEFAGALKTALKDDRIHAVILLYCQTAITDPNSLADAIINVIKENGKTKPLVISMVGGKECAEAMKKLNLKGLPAYPIPERAVSSLGAYMKWARYIGKI
ncbi:MAG: acetyl CoA synthetase, partial [archaeon GB-1845-036]|nr:acetyl CoA synthetase [Candidatus Culexmicrobium thermophilum]